MKHQTTEEERSLEYGMFGTFNVRIGGIEGVYYIGHINSLLRSCVVKGCNVIRLLKTKRDGIIGNLAAGYRVHFGGNYRGVEGRKRKHRVELAVKGEIVWKVGKGDIKNERISTRLLKARISYFISIVTFVVSHAPTGNAVEKGHGSPQ